MLSVVLFLKMNSFTERKNKNSWQWQLHREPPAAGTWPSYMVDNAIQYRSGRGYKAASADGR